MWAALLTGFGKLAGAFSDWWTARTAAQHDATVAAAQNTADQLAGAKDELATIARVESATGGPGVGVQSDPNNRNRQPPG